MGVLLLVELRWDSSCDTEYTDLQTHHVIQMYNKISSRSCYEPSIGAQKLVGFSKTMASRSQPCCVITAQANSSIQALYEGQ